MNTGTVISGLGHVALILGLLVGGWLGSEPPPPPDVSDVSIITEAEFAALALPQAEPETVFDVPTPSVPDVQDEPAPTPSAEDPPVAADAPEAAAPDTPDTLPEVPETPEPLEPELTEDTNQPPAPEIVQPDAPLLEPTDDTPAPQEAPRVAPIPVPESPPSPEIADTVTPRVAPDAESAETVEDQPEAAPEEATTEIVTEAETPSAAPPRSQRPTARPVRQAEAEPEPADENPAADAIADAVAAAVADADPAPDPAPAPSRPTGPPLTRGERDGLRVAVQQCWNIGSSSTEAQQTTVVVMVQMSSDAKPLSVTLQSSNGANDTATQIAFDAARRAVIRCASRGYDLPTEKYERWREIEITFNPDQMRRR